MSRLLADLRRSLPLYGAPLLLVVVACVQIHRAYAYGQSSWKGGGFGMFAALDAPDATVLRIYVVTDRGEKRVVTPVALRKSERLLRTVPTRDNLGRFAGELAKQTWVSGKQTSRDGTQTVRCRALRPKELKPPDARVLPVAALKVELWRRTFDASTGSAALTKALACEHRLRPHPPKAESAVRRGP
jgi:hypothetical protein